MISMRLIRTSVTAVVLAGMAVAANAPGAAAQGVVMQRNLLILSGCQVKDFCSLVSTPRC